MIWATVCSPSYFWWLYRASPSLGAKNIINLISVLTICWCPCVEIFSCVFGRGCLLWPVRSLGKTLLAFAWLHSVFWAQEGWEELLHVQGQEGWPWGDTLHPRKGAVAALCWSSCEVIPHVQGKRNPSKTVGVLREHQRADTLKP